MTFWRWFLILDSGAGESLLWTDPNEMAEWAERLFAPDVALDRILSQLLGDDFLENNRNDVAKLEREVGRAVITLFTTDAIFNKYPHLRGLARDREFEIQWAKVKQKTK